MHLFCHVCVTQLNQNYDNPIAVSITGFEDSPTLALWQRILFVQGSWQKSAGLRRRIFILSHLFLVRKSSSSQGWVMLWSHVSLGTSFLSAKWWREKVPSVQETYSQWSLLRSTSFLTHGQCLRACQPFYNQCFVQRGWGEENMVLEIELRATHKEDIMCSTIWVTSPVPSFLQS